MKKNIEFSNFVYVYVPTNQQYIIKLHGKYERNFLYTPS